MGDTFYIIEDGEVTVEELRSGEEEPRILTSLFSGVLIQVFTIVLVWLSRLVHRSTPGAHFGEYSLIRTQPRVASVVARGIAGTTCRFLVKSAFKELVAVDLEYNTILKALVSETEETRRKREVVLMQSGGSGKANQVSFVTNRSNAKFTQRVQRGYNDQRQEFVNSYVFLRQLGSGTYGRVHLCKDILDHDRIYAIKVKWVCRCNLLCKRYMALFVISRVSHSS